MADPELTLSRARFDAVLFDLDGVVTHTDALQALAWKGLFDTWLREHAPEPGEDHSAFDADRDYRRYIAGRPRDKGVKHFLLARGVELPEGAPEDGPEQDTINGLGQRKNELFMQLIDEQGVDVYGCAVTLLRRLRRAGIKTGCVTASKNCNSIMERAGIRDLFDARVDGHDAEREDLAGKPDPDTLLEVARRLGTSPARTAVLEDSVAGVRAASRGRFGLVIGVDRDGRREALAKESADLVFEDLCHIQVAEAETPSLVDDPAALMTRLGSRRPALFLDYDGVLTPIAADPADARLHPELRRLLHQLALAVPLAVISGRDLEDLRRLIGLPRLIYAGSHGFDIRGPDLRLELPEGVNTLDDLTAAKRALDERLAGIEGMQLERKRFAVAVHCRNVPEADRARVDEAVDRLVADFPRLRRTGGKAIIELRPDVDWDKGRAVRWLLAEMGLDGTDALPIYIGDDETDEDAFRELRDDGISILVADQERSSAATWRFADRDQVVHFLQQLAATVSP